MLGVAEGTVKSRCARGRARLGVMLGHLAWTAIRRSTGEPGVTGRRNNRAPERREPGRCGMSRYPRSEVELDRWPTTPPACWTRPRPRWPTSSAPTRAGRRATPRCGDGGLAVRADLAAAATIADPYQTMSRRRSTPHCGGSVRPARRLSLSMPRGPAPTHGHGGHRRRRGRRRCGDGWHRPERRPHPARERSGHGPRWIVRLAAMRRRLPSLRWAMRIRARRATRGCWPRVPTTGWTRCHNWRRLHPRRSGSSDAKAETPQSAPSWHPSAGPADLPSGLGDCLRAVAGKYPGVAVVLDYARFEGHQRS